MPFVIQEDPEKVSPFPRWDSVQAAKQMLMVAAVWSAAAVFTLYLWFFGDRGQDALGLALMAVVVLLSGIVVVPLALVAAAYLIIRSRRRRRSAPRVRAEAEEQRRPPRSTAL